VSEVSAAVQAGTSRLPRNFEGLRATLAEPFSYGVTYELGCACGAPFFRVEAGRADDGGFVDPVAVHCDSCGLQATIFDSSSDGYDGRLNDGACYEQSYHRVPVSCVVCGETQSALLCLLAYNNDFNEEGDLELLARAPDLFDWIEISTKCSNGHAEQELGGWEMA
jgi:ribosomal protein S27E